MMNLVTARVLDRTGSEKARDPRNTGFGFGFFRKLFRAPQSFICERQSGRTAAMDWEYLAGNLFTDARRYIQVGCGYRAALPAYTADLQCIRPICHRELDTGYPDWDWADTADIANLAITFQATFPPGSLAEGSITEAALLYGANPATCLVYGCLPRALPVTPGDTLQIQFSLAGPLTQVMLEDLAEVEIEEETEKEKIREAIK
jgi:hypothetical protein